MNQKHLHFMHIALSLAERGRFTVSPNPMVGCVLVQKNRIVGQGFHMNAGGAHAEIHALQEAGERAKGATAYITLEPCCHYGKTPPCTHALIEAGIKKIWVACLDPNPLVSGKGIEAIKASGIDVEVGLCETEAIQLNSVFFHYIKHKRPFVYSKWAISLDGKTITNSADSRLLSGKEAEIATQRLRQAVDAIIIGANTLREDNPQLTARLLPSHQPITKQPLRIVLAGRKKISGDFKLFNSTLPGKTLIVATQHSNIHSSIQAEVLVMPSDEQGYIHLPSLLDELGRREIGSILVEGGMTVHQQFFKEGLVNRVCVYLSPFIVGALTQKQWVTHLKCSPLGQDFLITGDFHV